MLMNSVSSLDSLEASIPSAIVQDTQAWTTWWDPSHTHFPWQPTAAQQALFIQLYAAILQGNRQFNLTRITEPADFWEKHLWDSLSGMLPWFLEPPTHRLKAIDIGTGCGFPGLAIAIVFPQIQVTLMDSTRKKLVFLDQVIENLGLNNAKTIVERAETLGQQSRHRGQYDLALIRAVGGASLCAEYSVPFLKEGGTAILYRGQWSQDEADQLPGVAELLGSELTQIQPWTTPLTAGVRHCVYLQKQDPTPKTYPRAIGLPSQKPL